MGVRGRGRARQFDDLNCGVTRAAVAACTPYTSGGWQQTPPFLFNKRRQRRVCENKTIILFPFFCEFLKERREKDVCMPACSFLGLPFAHTF